MAAKNLTHKYQKKAPQTVFKIYLYNIIKVEDLKLMYLEETDGKCTCIGAPEA